VKTEYRLITRIPRGDSDPHLDQCPVLFFHEVVEREIRRVIEIWADGHTGLARNRDMLGLGGSMVPDQLDPEPLPTINWPVEKISREQFEDYWKKAVQRVRWELGAGSWELGAGSWE
jgi:hypothetical protein